jgi:hypothetical protein
MIDYLLPASYIVGQVLEIIGAWLLFQYGVPKHVLTDSPFGASGASDARPQKEKENKDYRKWSRIGFRLIFFGFLIQLPMSISNICQSPTYKHSNECTTPNCEAKGKF